MDCTMERLIHSWNDATQISRSAGHCETFASAAAPNDESILVYLCLFPHSKCKCWETILQIKGFLTLCFTLSSHSRSVVAWCRRAVHRRRHCQSGHKRKLYHCSPRRSCGGPQGSSAAISASYATAECIKQMVADNHKNKMK
jgi:hypothetical protein